MTQNHFNCPYCKGQLSLKALDITQHSPLTPWTPLGEFQNVSQSPLPGQPGSSLSGEWQKVTPLGRLSARDVGTTLLDSVIVFGLVSAGLGLVCHLSGVTWLVGPSVGLFVGTARYLYGLSHVQGLLTIVEYWRSAEPKPGQPASQPERVVKVEIKEGKAFKYAFFGLEESKLIAFSEALLNGAKFTEEQAKKHNINQAELKTFREELINRGLAYWNNPAQPRMGVTLHRSCYRVLQAIIDSKQQQAAADQED